MPARPTGSRRRQRRTSPCTPRRKAPPAAAPAGTRRAEGRQRGARPGPARWANGHPPDRAPSSRPPRRGAPHDRGSGARLRSRPRTARPPLPGATASEPPSVSTARRASRVAAARPRRSVAARSIDLDAADGPGSGGDPHALALHEEPSRRPIGGQEIERGPARCRRRIAEPLESCPRVPTSSWVIPPESWRRSASGNPASRSIRPSAAEPVGTPSTAASTRTRRGRRTLRRSWEQPLLK